MPILVPKQIIPVKPTLEAPLFFLAGPIRGGGDWQKDMAIELMQHCNEAQIACPSRWTAEHALAEHFFQPFSQAENRQLVWERHYMEQAAIGFSYRISGHTLQEPMCRTPGCLIFWLPLESTSEPHPGPEPYAMDTRRELGKYAALVAHHRARVVIGGNSDFFGLDVILNEFADASSEETFPFYRSMRNLAKAALFKARTTAFNI